MNDRVAQAVELPDESTAMMHMSLCVCVCVCVCVLGAQQLSLWASRQLVSHIQIKVIDTVVQHQ